MDRLAFKERLKLYKQAKEQNPLLKYYEFKDAPKYSDGGPVYYGGQLPEVTVTEKMPTDYIILGTDYPIVSNNARWTGHSSISLTPGTPAHNSIISYNGSISKGGHNKGYDLLTNNCSDETRRALEMVYNKKINPFLFTTPGDVRDFALDELNGIPFIKGDSIFNVSSGLYKPQDKEYMDLVRKAFKGHNDIFIPIPRNKARELEKYMVNGNKNNRFADGTDSVTFKAQPNSERPITGYNPVTGNFTIGYNPGAGYTNSVLSTNDMPVIGDAMDAVLVGKDVNNGNYGMAALGAGLMFLPDMIAKPIKKFVGNKLVKPVKEFFDNEVHPNLTISRNQPDWDAIINNISNMNKRDANGILLNPVSTTPKVDDVKVLGTGNGVRYMDYGTIPMEASIGTPIPENMLHVIDFYNKDVFARELGDNNIYISPYTFNRSNMTFPNNKPIQVRDYLDDVDFGGYASPDGTLVLAKNGGFEPDETIVHEGAHRDQFRRIEAMLKDLTEEERNKLNIIDVTDIAAREKYGSGKYAYSREHTNALNDAYTFDEEFLEKYPDVSLLLEKGATNREMRYNISKENGFKFNKELDDVIDNMTIDEIGYHMMSANSYSRSFWRDILKSGVSKEEAVRKIKYALKTVPALAPVALTLGINNKEDKSN